mmetsp:Transcript_31573/g.92570  ORF Transcript_31573/g.92570 Transcript_31573/m.92570 type:complete len:235 (-) Transcript_31573:1088-1792(-)
MPAVATVVGPSSYRATVLGRIYRLGLSLGAMDAPRRIFPVSMPVSMCNPGIFSTISATIRTTTLRCVLSEIHRPRLVLRRRDLPRPVHQRQSPLLQDLQRPVHQLQGHQHPVRQLPSRRRRPRTRRPQILYSTANLRATLNGTGALLRVARSLTYSNVKTSLLIGPLASIGMANRTQSMSSRARRHTKIVTRVRPLPLFPRRRQQRTLLAKGKRSTLRDDTLDRSRATTARREE